MAEYVMQEMNNLQDDKKKRMYARMANMRVATYKMVVDDLTKATGVPAAQIAAVLTALPERMAFWFDQNHSVKIDGLGLFTPTLGTTKYFNMDSDKVNERSVNADMLGVNAVAFRADSDFMRMVNGKVHLKRSQYVKTIRPKESPYTQEERKEMLLDYIEKNGSIKGLDYCRLVKLKRTAGYNELRALAAEGVVRRRGSGPCLVYVKAED